jgi:hypothetical protein
MMPTGLARAKHAPAETPERAPQRAPENPVPLGAQAR